MRKLLNKIITKIKLWKYKKCKNIRIDDIILFKNTELQISKSAEVEIYNLTLKPYCTMRIRDNAKVTIKKNCYFNNGCMITARKNIIIGENCSFGPNVMIFDHDHDMKSDNYKQCFVCKDIKIGNNVWVGANVVILKGSEIGDNCVIAAGSVVFGKVEENCIYYNRKECIQKKINR